MTGGGIRRPQTNLAPTFAGAQQDVRYALCNWETKPQNIKSSAKTAKSRGKDLVGLVVIATVAAMRAPSLVAIVSLFLSRSDAFRAPLGSQKAHARIGRPVMDAEDEDFRLPREKFAITGSTVPSPVKWIATVIAQAEIVGVEQPNRVPNTFPAPKPKFPRFNWDVLPKPTSTPTKEPRLPNNARREVDRDCVHPLLKLGDGETTIEPLLTSLLALPQPALLAVVGPVLVACVPLLAVFVAARKSTYAREVAASAAEHFAAFDAAWCAYREEQRRIVNALLDSRATGTRDPLLPDRTETFTVCVTMATGQEGAAVVKALSAATDTFPNIVVRALVRNPDSAKARALAALPNVVVVTADSLEADSLASAMEGADAAYLCTTLNHAGAGTWSMGWDGGKYEVDQGVAFADACERTPTLKQIVYGTAPVRKWPEAYRVEPPIHYVSHAAAQTLN